MKKILSTLIAILFFAGVSFAQEPKKCETKEAPKTEKSCKKECKHDEKKSCCAKKDKHKSTDLVGETATKTTTTTPKKK